MIDTDNFTEEEVLQALENFLTVNGALKISMQKEWPFGLRDLCAKLYKEHSTARVPDGVGAQFIFAATNQKKGIAPIIDGLISRGIIARTHSPEDYIYLPQLD